MNICYYGCGREATVQFDNGRWCCEDSFHRCPAERERRRQRMLEKYRNGKRQRMQREIDAGIHRCAYCGELATRWFETIDKMCCVDFARNCPGYHDYLSNRNKLKFQENPELLEQMSDTMLKVQNRPEVKEAKRLKMLHLHNDNCDECQEYKQKFLKGHKDRRGPNYKRNKRYLERSKK